MNPAELQNEVRRFWKRVDRSGECWLWTGTVTNHGYGQYDFWHDSTRARRLAHRIALELSGTPVGVDDVVLHRCDTPLCVNPSHLNLGTQTDNMRDALQKGRLDLSGLTAETPLSCRMCGADFFGAPNRRYCDDHLYSKRRRRSA